MRGRTAGWGALIALLIAGCDATLSASGDASTAGMDGSVPGGDGGTPGDGGTLDRDSVIVRPDGSEPSGPGVFLVVGESQAIASSRDGRTWSDRTIDTGNPGTGFRNAGAGDGLLLAVGGAGAAGIVMRTRDGDTWERSNTLTEWVGGADEFPERGVIVAAGGNGARWISRDGGASFEITTRFMAGAHYRGVAAGAGVVVAAGHLYDNSEGVLSVSADGTSWEDQRLPGTSSNNVQFVGGYFVAGSNGGLVAYSSDGRGWSMSDSGESALQHAAYVGDRFVVGGQDRAYASTDLSTWSPLPSTFPERVVRGGALYVGVYREGRRYVSSDGDSWEMVRDATGPQRALVFAPFP